MSPKLTLKRSHLYLVTSVHGLVCLPTWSGATNSICLWCEIQDDTKSSDQFKQFKHQRDNVRKGTGHYNYHEPICGQCKPGQHRCVHGYGRKTREEEDGMDCKEKTCNKVLGA